MIRHALLVLALAGCPSSYVFNGHVFTAKSDRADILAVSSDGELHSDQLVPIAGAKIECDGCPDKIIADDRGKFRVSLGTGYSTAKPVVLRISAPSFQTVELEVVEPPSDSQLGYADFVIVLKRSSR